MPAGKYNFTIEQGADFDRQLTWLDGSGNPVDLTGMTARMKVKTTTGKLVASLTSSTGITLGGETGVIAWHMSAATTAAMAFGTDDKGVYDLELVASDNRVVRLIQGKVKFSREVTD